MSTKRNLEKQAKEQWNDQQVTVLAHHMLAFKTHKKGQFKLQKGDELRVDPRNPAHHILLQIIYIDNLYKIYAVLKASNARYLKRTNWRLEE